MGRLFGFVMMLAVPVACAMVLVAFVKLGGSMQPTQVGPPLAPVTPPTTAAPQIGGYEWPAVPPGEEPQWIPPTTPPVAPEPIPPAPTQWPGQHYGETLI